MTLYIYNTATGAVFDTVEAERYDGDGVYGAFGMLGLGEEMEYSEAPDLSQALRAQWRRDNPTLDELVGILLGVNDHE